MKQLLLILCITLGALALTGCDACSHMTDAGGEDAGRPLYLEPGVVRPPLGLSGCGPQTPEGCAWFAEMARRYEHQGLGPCEPACPAVFDGACVQAIALANNCARLEEAAARCECP